MMILLLDVGSVADVSETHAVSILRVDVRIVGECWCISVGLIDLRRDEKGLVRTPTQHTNFDPLDGRHMPPKRRRNTADINTVPRP
jgi:hypothetical protein